MDSPATMSHPESLRSLRHFLAIRDIEPRTLADLIDFAIMRKAQFRRGQLERVLTGRVLAMVFQKSSLRTRLGFEAAMAQLGGHAINLDDHHIGLAKREAPRDVARVVSSMCDAIMARVFDHQSVVDLAKHGSVPVINGLSDWSHPCQAVADLMTIREHFGRTEGLKVAYVGDGNNVARSLMNACAKLGAAFRIASPNGYELESHLLDEARGMAIGEAVTIQAAAKPREAVAEADVVYTDVWTSMGQESEREQRLEAFAGYQINAELMSYAKSTAVVMHCLPAHRGEEITDEVLDGPQSIVFEQAENRLHSQRALLEVLIMNSPRGG